MRAAPVPRHTAEPAQLYLHKHLQHALFPCMFKSIQSLIQGKSCADQRTNIYFLLAQSMQRRLEGAAARSLHADFVDNDGCQV